MPTTNPIPAYEYALQIGLYYNKKKNEKERLRSSAFPLPACRSSIHF